MFCSPIPVVIGDRLAGFIVAGHGVVRALLVTMSLPAGSVIEIPNRGVGYLGCAPARSAEGRRCQAIRAEMVATAARRAENTKTTRAPTRAPTEGDNAEDNRMNRTPGRSTVAAPTVPGAR